MGLEENREIHPCRWKMKSRVRNEGVSVFLTFSECLLTFFFSLFFQGCFLIPYFICLIFAGVPILILEVALGQLTSQGGITAWLICPLFQGLYTVV